MMLIQRTFLKQTSKYALSPRVFVYSLVKTSFRMHSGNPTVTCIPSSSRMDEKVTIKMDGLYPNQKVSLQAKLVGESNDIYHSLGHYIADANGRVCLISQPSVGGSYTGIEPMGFMWSLQLEPKNQKPRRLLKRDVTEPYTVNLAVLDGHMGILETENCHILSTTSIERHYMGDGVRRIEILEGRIRGTLFLPPGKGPFPGVISLHNSFGFLFEDRTSLLASSGFAALSLGYWGYGDLPKNLDDVEFEYFLEGVEWFKNNSHVCRGGVGVIGNSSGASKALYLAAFCKDIKPVVWISGFHKLTQTMKRNGKHLDVLPSDFTKGTVNEDGSISTRVCFNGDTWCGDIKDDPLAIPIENAQGPFLLIYGTDDQCYNAEASATEIKRRLTVFGKGDTCTLFGCHGAGHVIYPGFNPPTLKSFQKSFGVTLDWGGEMVANVRAQEASWEKTKAFLKENLSFTVPKL